MQADELKYSLRSVEKNMPWINNIYIIVDNQTPNFINLKNEKIHIVDMKNFFPADALPNFNTNSIETVMGKIKCLSEYFILASDDMMVNKPLGIDYFYSKDLKPIIHVCNKRSKVTDWFTICTYICNAEVNGKVVFPYIQDCHNMTPHVKSDYNDVIFNGKYKRQFENTIYSQFRSYFNIQRILVYLILKKENKVIFKNLGTENGPKRWKDQLYCENSNKYLVKLFNPNLFCLNASTKQNEREIKSVKKFFEKKFPNKSSFER
ncbi:MAG: hypothetical protein LBB45_04840 [Methanobrevibacter sp.]|jgi:hypothetical protein|nr:hypothetical protein [Candidatus Methanovirga basalitermitum]